MNRRQLGGRREKYDVAVWTETILRPSPRDVQDWRSQRNLIHKLRPENTEHTQANTKTQ